MLLRSVLLCAVLGAFGCGAGSSAGDTTATAATVPISAPAPDATVRASDGTEVSLASLWADSNVAVVFYRGHW